MSIVVEKKFTSGGDSFNAEITFDTEQQAAEAGAKFVIWKLQRDAREGKLVPGETYSVDHEGNVYKSPEQLVAEMSPEQREELLAALTEAEAKAA